MQAMPTRRTRSGLCTAINYIATNLIHQCYRGHYHLHIIYLSAHNNKCTVYPRTIQQQCNIIILLILLCRIFTRPRHDRYAKSRLHTQARMTTITLNLNIKCTSDAHWMGRSGRRMHKEVGYLPMQII